MTLLELAKRCEKASGPDREIDAGIAKALGFEHGSREQVHYESRSVSYFDEVAPRFTASLDAAMTLVPEGLHWTGQTDRDGALMTVGKADSDARGIFYTDCEQGKGLTPALALTAAALRARAQQESQP